MLHAVTPRAPARPRTVTAATLFAQPFRAPVLAVMPVLVSMMCSCQRGGDVFRRAVTGCRDRYLARQGPCGLFSRLSRAGQKCPQASASVGLLAGWGTRSVSLIHRVARGLMVA